MAKKKLRIKVLIVSQYFYPENFRINDIAKYLKYKKYEVDIFTSHPDYPNKNIFKKNYQKKEKNLKFENCRVYRIPTIKRKSGSPLNLLMNYFSFVFMGLILSRGILKNKNYDFIFTFGTSPITVALVSNYIAKIKKAKSILWLLDLWPEIIGDLKNSRKNIFYYAAKLVSKNIYKNTDCILVQSKSFEKQLKKYTKNSKIIYFPAWAETLKKTKKNNLVKNNNLKIVFTGNIGEAQNFEKVMVAAKELKNDNLEWIIVGGGRYLENIKKRIFENNINNFHILGYKNVKEVYKYHKLADILLLPLKGSKYISKTIPGKLQTYLASNKFILGFANGDSAKEILRSKAGIIVDPNRPDILVKKIRYLIKNRKIIDNREKNIDTLKYVKKYFDKKKLLRFLDKNILELYIQ